MAGSPLPHRSRRRVKEETKLVLEAFLQETLRQGPEEAPGHVGRSYHDPHSYMCRFSNEHDRQRPAWTHLHEEINRVEESKHGFRTNFKRLLQRRSSPREATANQPSSKDSLKRNKAVGDVGEGARQKRSFTFKNLLRKKGASTGDTKGCAGPPQRPDSLPLDSCYCGKLSNEKLEPQTENKKKTSREPGQASEVESAELYTLVAQKLDHLVKQQQLSSPQGVNGLLSPIDQLRVPPADPASSIPANSGELPDGVNAKQKEQILQKLIALLEEQAGVINEEIEADPLLRNTISRLSYRSFSRLAEAFTSHTPPGIPSPQLAKLALTMELTRKVAGINSHAVHTIMGYSLQYMDMFVPWLQQQGGWETLVTQEEIFDLQLD